MKKVNRREHRGGKRVLVGNGIRIDQTEVTRYTKRFIRRGGENLKNLHKKISIIREGGGGSREMRESRNGGEN